MREPILIQIGVMMAGHKIKNEQVAKAFEPGRQLQLESLMEAKQMIVEGLAGGNKHQVGLGLRLSKMKLMRNSYDDALVEVFGNSELLERAHKFVRVG